jgi:hypothetical protein
LVESLVVLLLGATQLRNSFEGAGGVVNEAIVEPLLHLTPHNTGHIVWVMDHHIGAPASLLGSCQGTHSVGDFIIIVMEVVRVTNKAVF